MTLREMLMLHAGVERGQKILYVQLARNHMGGSCDIWIRAAREAHHRYLRLRREAEAST